jgi:hypothetical protein
MNSSLESVVRRQVRLEREVFVWRLVLVLVVAGAAIAAAAVPQSQSAKEIRLASADGKNVVTLSADGLTMERGGRRLAQLTFETVGDGAQQNVLLKMNGFVAVESGTISVGPPLNQHAAIHSDGFSIVQGGTIRAALNPGVLAVADSSERTKAELTADDQGLVGLSLLYDQKQIAALASAGRFFATNPPKRDAANLSLSDFGGNPKSRLLTPSEDTKR